MDWRNHNFGKCFYQLYRYWISLVEVYQCRSHLICKKQWFISALMRWRQLYDLLIPAVLLRKQLLHVKPSLFWIHFDSSSPVIICVMRKKHVPNLYRSTKHMIQYAYLISVYGEVVGFGYKFKILLFHGQSVSLRNHTVYSIQYTINSTIQRHKLLICRFTVYII